MEQKNDWMRLLKKSLSYILVAAAASVLTIALQGGSNSKLAELEKIIDRKFIGQADMGKAQDAAANAMVNALGDQWSYYISAEEYAKYLETANNTYVGVGITVQERQDGTGIDILEVAPGGPAQEAGIRPGDVLVKAEGKSVAGMTVDELRTIIQGEVGTKVPVEVLRDGAPLMFNLERRNIQMEVAKGTMLEGNIGLVRINNFNTNCAKDTITAIKALQEQGAKGLVFDVRFNLGGYVSEMVEVLDYLLPKGVLFRDEDYRGITSERRSDEACVELPMAVIVNGNSYSAAEFFAAVLREYNWATVIGEQTCGKGYYQNVILLSDGSAVNLSTGKYFTPNGTNLTETGGLTPDVPVQVDAKTAAMIYAQLLPVEEDVQIQAAIVAVQQNMG